MRRFDPDRHIVAIAEGPKIQVRNGRNGDLEGVIGRPGPQGHTISGQRLGLDEITMRPGTKFDLHEHEGDHVLYVLEGRGGITIDDVTYELRSGDSVFVPAEYPHGVTTLDSTTDVFRFLAVGIPHHALDDDKRMNLVDPC